MTDRKDSLMCPTGSVFGLLNAVLPGQPDSVAWPATMNAYPRRWLACILM